MSSPIEQRQSGVLLHITSLPGPFKQGVLGQEACDFIDAIFHAGYRVWQFLPLGPTHSHGSPYESLSSSAGNPELIDLRWLTQQGWLPETELLRVKSGNILSSTARAKASLLFWKQLRQNPDLTESIRLFQEENSAWLNDYALFTSLKIAHEGMAWWQWPEALRDRDPEALKAAKGTLQGHLQQVYFEQWVFHEQWKAIQLHAESRGVRLFGDLPIYVAHDSSDVWAHRDYFTVNDEGLCDEVAGVPPDYFSKTGQRWGNPLYVWEHLKATGFQWWIDRVAVQMKRMHMIRIDHFRGLESFWVIPEDRDDGIVGEWRKAPGAELLQALRDHFGSLPLIAEDLGLITPEVNALRQSFSLLGMKILQFAFGGNADNPYLPHQHTHDMVAYTGTHDNNTTLGWWHAASQEERQHVQDYLGVTNDQMPWALIRSALVSSAILAIIPMQDLLELRADARFNTPGTLDDNWCWRMLRLPNRDEPCWLQSKQLNKLYGRC